MADDFDPPDDENETPDVSVSFTRGKRGNGKEHEPVRNSQSLPLFPDMEQDARHVIVGLHVHKITSPGEGFKGVVAPTATLETIGRTFGNGRYNIHAVNDQNKTLRRLNDVPISLATIPTEARGPAPSGMGADMRLLEFQAAQHEKDAERSAALAKESSQQNREMTEKHLKMVETSTQAQIARDREFFQAQGQMQREFFAGILQFTAQNHQQTMERIAANHQHMITTLEQGHQRALAASDPTLLLTLFRQGLETGRGMESEGSDNPLLQTGNMLLGGLREARTMMMLKNANPPAMLAQSGNKPERANGQKTQQTPANKPAATGERPVDPQRLMGKLGKLKILLESKDIDLEDFLDQNLEHIANLPDSDPDEDEESNSNEQGIDDSPANGPTTGAT